MAGEQEGGSSGRPPIAPGLDRRVTMGLRNTSVRSLFDVIVRTSGMNLIFDRDVPPDLQTTIFLCNTTVRSAIGKIVLTSGLAWQVIDENITYVDVGLKLEVEPQIFPGNEIALKLGMEVSSINSTIQNSSSGTVAYRIGTRNATTVLRLKDGENQILGGLIQDGDKKSVTKVPLIGDIPLLGRLFRSNGDDKSKT